MPEFGYNVSMATIDGRTLDHTALAHLRQLAVKRVVEDGESPSAVMRSFGFSRTAIYPWLRKWKDEGWESLVERIFREVRAFRIYDGPSEVHRWSLARRVMRHGANW